jgi:hypothetical protein
MAGCAAQISAGDRILVSKEATK